jgi:hypothetical protein
VDGRVAQLVEQCPFKAWVAGSNPAALTKISSGFVRSVATKRDALNDNDFVEAPETGVLRRFSSPRQRPMAGR